MFVHKGWELDHYGKMEPEAWLTPVAHVQRRGYGQCWTGETFQQSFSLRTHCPDCRWNVPLPYCEPVVKQRIDVGMETFKNERDRD